MWGKGEYDIHDTKNTGSKLVINNCKDLAVIREIHNPNASVRN